jgi:general secretion pathway protein E
MHMLPESLKDLGKVEPFPDLSVRYLKETGCLPLGRVKDKFYLAMVDPGNQEARMALETALGQAVIPVPLPEAQILRAIDEIYLPGSHLSRLVGDLDPDEAEAVPDETSEIGHLRVMAQEAPIIQLVNLIIRHAIEMGASDIHLEPFENDFKVRYRKDGLLLEVESPSKKSQAAVISRLKIMAKMDIAERRLPQDGRFRANFNGRDIDFRVSTLPTLMGESMVIRILDQEQVILDLSHLGFPEPVLEKFDHLIQKPYGLILVTGPTGSGKTTTLYAALKRINSPEKKIITVEDPVEYRLAGVTQVQVLPKIGLTFASGLRHILRQDPDIILIGEIRDRETAEIAIHAALTGHLVFSTIHTNDAAGAVSRLLEMGIEDYLLASAAIGFLGQRLVRLLCPHCRVPLQSARSAHSPSKDDFIPLQNSSIGLGCDHCNDTGYQGRSGIYELLLVDEPIRQLILARTDASTLRETAQKRGMQTIVEDGWLKVAQGLTSIQELMRVTQE